MNRFAAASAFGALLLCLPIPASAQDAPVQSSPTPAPVLTDPQIPGDFSLQPSDNTPQVVGPTRPGDAPPRENAAPQGFPTPSPPPAASRQPQVEPEVRQPAATTSSTPRAEVPVPRQGQAQVPPQELPQEQGAAPLPDTQASVEAPSDVASDAAAVPIEQDAPGSISAEPAATEVEGGFGWTAIALLLAALAGLALLIVVLRRRSSSDGVTGAKAAAPEVERPVLTGGEAKPQPIPAPTPKPVPAPVSTPRQAATQAPTQAPPPIPQPAAPAPVPVSGLVQSRAKAPPARDNSGLVTVRPPTAPRQNNGLVTARVPNNGLVTTNLAQKQRERAQAAPREPTQPAQRQAPRPVAVKRNINFDWS